MDKCNTYEAWREAAIEHDELSGQKRWREVDQTSQYDYAEIRLRLDRLRRDNPSGGMLDSFPLEHSYGFAIQGLIGHDLLHDAILTLDFPAMQLLLTPVDN